jgi:iron complex transport system substrate-binding protein
MTPLQMQSLPQAATPILSFTIRLQNGTPRSGLLPCHNPVIVKGKTRMKKLLAFALLLCSLLLLPVLAGCGGGSPLPSTTSETSPTTSSLSASTTTSQPTSSTEAPEAPSTVTVTDAANRTVTLTADVEGVVSVYGLQYVLALGFGDKVLNGSSTEFYNMVVPGLKDKPSIVSSGNISAEAIAGMKPDVFIHKSTATDLFDTLDTLGIPSIGIHMETVDEIVSTVDLLGTALGAEDRAKELEDYYVSLMDKAAELVSGVAEADRVTAILMGGTLGQVAHGAMLQSVMMETAGGINMAAGIQSENTWPVAGTEKIFEWNPDYIFIQNSIKGEYTLEDLQKDSTWAELQAIKNGHVYVVPSNLDSWEFPGLGSAIGTLWMASKMYPALYGDKELETDITQFYQKVYGMSLDRAALGY